jgi:hypothetical protein
VLTLTDVMRAAHLLKTYQVSRVTAILAAYHSADGIFELAGRKAKLDARRRNMERSARGCGLLATPRSSSFGKRIEMFRV